MQCLFCIDLGEVGVLLKQAECLSQHLTLGAWVVLCMVHHTQKTDYAQEYQLHIARFISPPEPGKLHIICMLMCAA